MAKRRTLTGQLLSAASTPRPGLSAALQAFCTSQRATAKSPPSFANSTQRPVSTHPPPLTMRRFTLSLLRAGLLSTVEGLNNCWVLGCASDGSLLGSRGQQLIRIQDLTVKPG